jgi:cytoskeleton protein RodZ
MAAGVYDAGGAYDPYGSAVPGSRHVLAGQWNVGLTLRSAREAGGESLEDVAEAIRIPADYLLAIEDENYYGLPGWAHAVGYVRSYALYLGLDPGPLVKRVRDQLALREHVFAQRAAVNSIRLTRLLSTGGIAIAVAAVVIGLYFTGPAESLTAYLAPVPDRILSFFDRSFGDRPATAGRLAAKSDAGPAAVVAAPTAPGTKVMPDVRAMTISPAVTRPSGPPPGVFTLRPLPRHTLDRGAALPGEVTLRARDTAWFRVEDRRGGLVADRRMIRGEVQKLPDVRDLVIMTRNAGAIEYYVDGAFAGTLGRDGQSVTGLSLADLAVRRAGG